MIKKEGVSKGHPLLYFKIMFISFASPKEMNQRKGVRKRQPVPLAALRVGIGSHLFRLSIHKKPGSY